MATRLLDLIVRNVRVVRPHRPEVERLDLGVKDGRFALIAPEIPASDAVEVYDARGRLGFPGVVDAHTHVGMACWTRATSRSATMPTSRCSTPSGASPCGPRTRRPV